MHKCRCVALVGCILFLSTALVSNACAQSTLQIAAAADLAPVLPVILAEFQTKAGVATHVTFASSATLATQILNGAPFDLFLSADMAFAQRVIDQDHGDQGHGSAPVPYAQGTLVLWERNDGPIHPFTLDSLTSDSVKSLAIANPAHAPYGRAAMAALNTLHLTEAVKPKLRVAENIAQAAQFVESGNAEFGLISLTSARTPQLQSEGSFVELPASSYPPIVQGAVVLKGSHTKDAQALLDYLLSKPVEDELAARGLKAPQ